MLEEIQCQVMTSQLNLNRRVAWKFQFLGAACQRSAAYRNHKLGLVFSVIGLRS